MNDFPNYKQVRYFIDTYGKAGIPDQRAVQDFMDCETGESVNSLRGELIGMTNQKFKEEILDTAVGAKRKILYESYDNWARLMLQWIASYKP